MNITSAGVIITNENNQILVLYRGEPFNDVSFPKGKQENNETLEQTAIRETKEETGFDVQIIRKIGVNKYEYFWEPTKEHVVKEVHYFLGKVTGGYLTNDFDEKDNVQKFEWVDKNKLYKLVKHETERKILDSI
jgi:8-oxo-dGTP pyrophosphatase MutT (NUDIX family)